MIVVDASVLSVAHMGAARAELALTDLAELPMRRAPHRPVLQRAWELRQTVSAYDAAYIALAEALGVALVTADVRLSRAPGVRCHIDVVGR